MINYILLVSRQGTEAHPTGLVRSETSGSQRQSQVTEMVHHDAPEGQSQDRQGCNPARTREADEDVQFPGVQGCVGLCGAWRPVRPSRFRGADDVFFVSSFLDTKVVYRRYASLFFVCGISAGDNELATLEIVHRYVEVLDRYFGNVGPLPSHLPPQHSSDPYPLSLFLSQVCELDL